MVLRLPLAFSELRGFCRFVVPLVEHIKGSFKSGFGTRIWALQAIENGAARDLQHFSKGSRHIDSPGHADHGTGLGFIISVLELLDRNRCCVLHCLRVEHGLLNVMHVYWLIASYHARVLNVLKDLYHFVVVPLCSWVNRTSRTAHI